MNYLPMSIMMTSCQHEKHLSRLIEVHLRSSPFSPHSPEIQVSFTV